MSPANNEAEQKMNLTLRGSAKSPTSYAGRNALGRRLVGHGKLCSFAPSAAIFFASTTFACAWLILFIAPCFGTPRLGTPPAISEELARGSVVEKVICRSDQTQSYALFLPSAYTPAKRWPIIYGFDPGARGRVPVERFKAAAEKYGYIVVGSNNSRNGAREATMAAIKAVLDDTQARFSIDDARIYAAGFSGGRA
jgi:hypothetical protein